MRDIVTASYNHTPKTGTHKTDYRSYKDFLENYSESKGTKDDLESVSSTDSGVSSCKLSESKSNNTSTSSLNSDVNGGNAVFSKVVEPTPTAVIMGGTRTGSFRNYLDTYNNKRFSPVKPVISSKPTNVTTTIKSEIVIQVSDPLDFEKRPSTNPVIKPVIIERPPLPPSLSLPSPPQQERVSPVPLSYTSQPTVLPPPPPPPPLPQHTTDIPPPPPILGLLGCNVNQQKKWATVETDENNRQTVNEQPKIPKSNMAAANLAKILNEHVLARRKISETSSESPSSAVNISSENCEKRNGTHINNNASTLPRQLSSSVSPPRPLLKTTPTKIHTSTASLPRGSKLNHHNEKLQVLPKLPPSLPKVQRTISPKAATATNGGVDSVDFCTTTVVPVTDGAITVNKDDSNVKKLVYNTYRGLLGAYNNKANDMISTLPRNMVREDKGVMKQVESIASQCRLDKLNGRINPKLEQE